MRWLILNYFITLTLFVKTNTVWTSLWPFGLNLPLWLTIPIYEKWAKFPFPMWKQTRIINHNYNNKMWNHVLKKKDWTFGVRNKKGWRIITSAIDLGCYMSHCLGFILQNFIQTISQWSQRGMSMIQNSLIQHLQ